MHTQRVIAEIIEATGWSQARLAQRLGVNQPDVSRWLKGSDPRGSNLEAIRRLAVELGIVPSERATTIPIVGYVGAGGDVDPDYEQVPEDGLEQIELGEPIGLFDDPVGFLVRGQSMMPAYKDGDVVLVERDQNTSTDSMIGDEAVVRTYDGKRYIKTIMPGSQPHTFDLVALNGPTYEDVRIAWASRVEMVLKKHVGRRTPVGRVESGRSSRRGRRPPAS